MAVVEITRPAIEPITLAEAKKQCRVDSDFDDDVIRDAIVGAREDCENFTHRAFITQTWQLITDHFPGTAEHYQGYTDLGIMGDSALGLGVPPVGYTYRFQSEVYFRAGAIIVPRPRLQSVDFIKYLDENGDVQTLDPSQYVVDTANEPARIAPAPNLNWPLTLISVRAPVLNAVVVQYKCGYGDKPEDVPMVLKLAMKMLVAHWYDNRPAAIAGYRVDAIEMPLAVDRLLWAKKVIYAAS